MLARFNTLFPLWAIALSLVAYQWPAYFILGKVAIVPLLSTIMFLMGLTLSTADFKRVLSQPKPIAIGTLLQFLIMPLAAYIIAHALALPAQIAAGLIIVGCCAGGTASNVIAYLAKANVALSITMTLCSTLLGVILTPFLCWLYIDTSIDINYLSMLLSMSKMVLVPVILGVTCHHLFPAFIRKVETPLASLAIMAIVIIIAIIVALNNVRLAQVGAYSFAAVILHNGFGFLSAYGISRALQCSRQDCRTIAIEVGMQNSGLGVTLALKYLGPLAALPGAIFSIWHNIMGALLASYWQSHSPCMNTEDSHSN